MKIRHLRKREEFAYVLDGKTRKRSSIISLHTRRAGEKEQDLVKVGIIATKKFVSKAVLRNYIRRVIYEHFRTNKELYSPGAMIVVRITRDLEKEAKRELSAKVRKELTKLSKELRIIAR